MAGGSPDWHGETMKLLGRAEDDDAGDQVRPGWSRRRLLLGAGVALLVVAAGLAVRRIDGSSQTRESVISRPDGTTAGSGASTTVPLGSSTTSGTDGIAEGARTSAPSVTPTTTPPTAPSTTTAPRPTTTTTAPPAGGTGTANLTFGGVLSGQLVNAVAHCDPRPTTGSGLTVNGILNGTPWVLFVQRYTGEDGVWQVLTGAAGGATGMVGQGYATTATYPATVPGVTQVDWAHGATLDVALTSRSDQAPAGDVHVQGAITCGP